LAVEFYFEMLTVTTAEIGNNPQVTFFERERLVWTGMACAHYAGL
jgi:hypothetical protein